MPQRRPWHRPGGERWFRDFDKLDVKPEIRPKIVKQNAIRLLGLDR